MNRPGCHGMLQAVGVSKCPQEFRSELHSMHSALGGEGALMLLPTAGTERIKEEPFGEKGCHSSANHRVLCEGPVLRE